MSVHDVHRDYRRYARQAVERGAELVTHFHVVEVRVDGKLVGRLPRSGQPNSQVGNVTQELLPLIRAGLVDRP